MTTGLYAAYVTVTKVEMVASMVCVMEHDEKGGDLSVYRCKITIKKDKPFDEKIGGLQERRPAKCTVLFFGCGRLLLAGAFMRCSVICALYKQIHRLILRSCRSFQ